MEIHWSVGCFVQEIILRSTSFNGDASFEIILMDFLSVMYKQENIFKVKYMQGIRGVYERSINCACVKNYYADVLILKP